jgi:hypothetical protein
MAGSYKRFKKALYCPNAYSCGSAKYEVREGDLILYREDLTSGENRRLARVLGLATHAGDGSKYPKPRLVVLAADDMLSHGYERHVALEDVVEIRDPGDFARWFLYGRMPAPDMAVKVQDYGAMNNNYLKQFLTEPEGEIRKDWFNVATRKAS